MLDFVWNYPILGEGKICLFERVERGFLLLRKFRIWLLNWGLSSRIGNFNRLERLKVYLIITECTLLFNSESLSIVIIRFKWRFGNQRLLFKHCLAFFASVKEDVKRRSNLILN